MSFELSDLRVELQRLDEQLIDLLAQRQDVSIKIGVVKQLSGESIDQPEIWKEQCTKRKERALADKVSTQLISEVFECIHRYSKAIQQKQATDE